MKAPVGLLLVAALLVSWCHPVSAETAADWEWSIAPYVWGPSASLDVRVNNDPVIATDASFEDLLDKTDFAFAIHFEGQCEHAGFFVDGIFLDLGADQSSAARPPLPGGTQTTVDADIGVYEAAGFYRPGGPGLGLDLVFGVRMFDYRFRLDATIPPPISATRSWPIDKNFIDAFGGVRYRVGFAERWDFAIRGDVGVGDTDVSWNALASFGVRLGKTDRYNLRLGWHHMELDVTADDDLQNFEIESDMTLTGPYLAFTMKY